MEDLVRWLSEQLDEDERIARAAAEPEKWIELNRTPQLSWSIEYWADPDRAAVVAEESSAYPVVLTAEGMDEADAEARVIHIAEHDPARVQREVDAKRQIVERYAWLREHGDTGGTAWVLPLLALPYADRPGYREEWRP